MSFVKAFLSDIFFLSVTALICFVLDHLLCPALAMVVVAKRRWHGRQMDDSTVWYGWFAAAMRETTGREAISDIIVCSETREDHGTGAGSRCVCGYCDGRETV